MIVFEFTLVLWLRGLTLDEYFRERDPVAATAYYLLLVVLAFMPLLFQPGIQFQGCATKQGTFET